MAHFALLNKENRVIQVIVVGNENLLENGIEVEQKGVDWLFSEFKIQNIYADVVKAVQTSYNSKIRNKYAGIGDEYIEELDVFRSHKPYASWILNDAKTDWVAPKQKPNGDYVWDESKLNWIEIKN